MIVEIGGLIFWPRMLEHINWFVGVLGDLVIVAVLFARRRVPRFPLFTILVAFHFLVAVGTKAAFHLSGHKVSGSTATIIDITDLLVRCGVFAELIRIALLPLARIWQLALGLLLIASGVLIVMRLAPAYHSLSMGLMLMHFFLSVLLLEWAMVLAFLLRPLRLSWQSPVAAISFGYGVFSAVDLAAGAYFRTGPAGDFVSSFLFRIPVYLLIVLWWSVSLWSAEPGVS